jgi:hypothetical protein
MNEVPTQGRHSAPRLLPAQLRHFGSVLYAPNEQSDKPKIMQISSPRRHLYQIHT